MGAVEESRVIQGVVVVQPDVYRDDRGFFVETWRRSWVPTSEEMVQSNRADRAAGGVVGLHYHRYQADYWYVPAGRARVVLHDLRTGSPTEGATLVLDVGGPDSAQFDHVGIYIPPGVAHGFAALTDVTITYLVDHTYDVTDELGVAWDDPAVGADWGVEQPVLSERDQTNPLAADLDPGMRPRWNGPPAAGAGAA